MDEMLCFLGWSLVPVAAVIAYMMGHARGYGAALKGLGDASPARMPSFPLE